MDDRVDCVTDSGGVGSGSDRMRASTPSASMHTAVSIVCGIGPDMKVSAIHRTVTLPRLLQKERYRDGAMMLGDESADLTGDTVLFRQFYPFTHVIADYRGASAGLELVVWVAAARLILHEVLWFAQLADVVIVRPNASQQATCADGVACSFAQIGHGDSVGVRPWRLQTETAQQRLIEIGPGQPAQVIGDAAPTVCPV